MATNGDAAEGEGMGVERGEEGWVDIHVGGEGTSWPTAGRAAGSRVRDARGGALPITGGEMVVVRCPSEESGEERGVPVMAGVELVALGIEDAVTTGVVWAISLAAGGTATGLGSLVVARGAAIRGSW